MHSKFGLKYTEQGSDIPEVKKALKGASKQGGSGAGKPEFVFLSNDILVVIEDKLSADKLVSKLDDETLNMNDIADFAVNGAVHYGMHIVSKTASFKEVIAIGVTGDTESHQILPYFVSFDDEQAKYKELNPLSTLQSINPENIDEWYNVNVLGLKSKEQQQVIELQNVAKELHEDLRNYGSLEGENKATVVSAILLALNEKSFDPKTLTGDSVDGGRDGDKILHAIDIFIKREGIMPLSKTKIMMNKFAFISTNVALNSIHPELQMTPLKYYTNKLNEEVIHHFKSGTDFDILGNFYGEFVRYGGSDGNSLGIVLTPRHITSLMSELIEVQPSDYVLDPACGSGAFLISAMNRMVNNARDKAQKEHIKKHQLLGIENQEKMFTVATTNMILRGDGKSNLQLANMFEVSALPISVYTGLSQSEREQKKVIPEVDKILFNPPYSQGKTDKTLTEISFIHHALDLARVGGKMAVIVPQSTMVGKSKEEKDYKRKILEKNTLELVITLNKSTFHGVGTNPCIAVFTAGIPHSQSKQVQFVNFEDDGFVVRKHIGLIDDGTGEKKKQYLLDVIRGNNFDFNTRFLVRSTITTDDEWLHSFYYFNDELPTDEDFESTIADYLTFQFDMYTHGRGYLFGGEQNDI
ncbi:adenine methyltransferase [Bacillus cereus]|nr:N-6 DNA methylase [Bacillus cereus]PFT62625.1 adenine methyltransferase [Bacillus cereus]